MAGQLPAGEGASSGLAWARTPLAVRDTALRRGGGLRVAGRPARRPSTWLELLLKSVLVSEPRPVGGCLREPV